VRTLPQLCRTLRCSRATVLRRLTEHGYYSSYNDSGKFFTIPEVAHFDSYGLWTCRTARFSKHGTLKDTLTYLVQSSPQGMTHEELAALLVVRVHNPLLELIRDGRLRRERIGPTFVYLHPKRTQQREQRSRRKAAMPQRSVVRPTPPQIIATLLELIQNPTATRQQIVRRCRRGGVAISLPVVDAIFERYELDKKRAP
jgi:hypothetical protein